MICAIKIRQHTHAARKNIIYITKGTKKFEISDISKYGIM